MKISVNDIELFTISAIEKQVLADYMPIDILEDDLKRRIKWVIGEVYKESHKALKSQWEPKLIAEGAKSLPTDKDEFAALCFAHPDYKDRSARESAALANEGV